MARGKYAKSKYDVVIIGAGLGGLIAGAHLAKRKQRVCICEQHIQPGGYFTTFNHKGYRFDGGIQGSEDSGMMMASIKQLGLQKRIQFSKSRFSIATDDFFGRMETPDDISLYFEELSRLFPREKSSLRKLNQDMLDFCSVIEGFTRMPNPLFQGPISLMSDYPKWIVRDASKLKSSLRFAKLMSVPIEDYIARYVDDRKLREILCQMTYNGTPASFGLSFLSYFLDYYYPKGGVQSLPDTLASSIVERGGEMRYRTAVKEIMTEGDRAVGIVTEDGEEIRSSCVINNGDMRRAYNEMIPEGKVPSEYLKRLENAGLSESCFCVFLGVDIPPKDIPTQGCHHVLLFSVNRNGTGEDADFYDDVFCEISVPSLHDASLAPEGKSVVILQTVANQDYSDYWGIKDGKKTERYEEIKQRVAEKMIKRAEVIIPGLSEKTEVKLAATPYTMERYTLNAGGASVGWTYNPKNTFAPGIKGMFNIFTPLKNLYQVGHWAMCPGGAPSGFLTGKMVADIVSIRLKTGI